MILPLQPEKSQGGQTVAHEMLDFVVAFIHDHRIIIEPSSNQTWSSLITIDHHRSSLNHNWIIIDLIFSHSMSGSSSTPTVLFLTLHHVEASLVNPIRHRGTGLEVQTDRGPGGHSIGGTVRRKGAAVVNGVVLARWSQAGAQPLGTLRKTTGVRCWYIV